jgi:beta propeller repeat protein
MTRAVGARWAAVVGVSLALALAGLVFPHTSSARWPSRDVLSSRAGASVFIQARFTIPGVPELDLMENAYHDIVDPQVSDGQIIYHGYSDYGNGWTYSWRSDRQERWPFPAPADLSHGIACICLSHKIVLSNGARSATLISGGTYAHARIDGDTVVWSEKRRATGWDIMAAEVDLAALTLNDRSVLCAARGDQRNPAVADGWVVWEDARRGLSDIRALDLATRRTRIVCGKAGDQVRPATDGLWVAWIDGRAGGHQGDIYARRLSGGPERALSVNARYQGEVVVGDGFIVWNDQRVPLKHLPGYEVGGVAPPLVDIRAYDTVSAGFFPIDAGVQRSCNMDMDMDGDLLVYVSKDDTRHGFPFDGVVRGVILGRPDSRVP